MKKRTSVILSLLAIFIGIISVITGVEFLSTVAEENANADGFKMQETKVADWLLAGSYYDEANNCFVLTEDNKGWDTGAIWYNYPYKEDFTLEMDYYTGVKDRPLDGADGIVVAFYANYTYTMGAGEIIGFDGCGGYGVELDTYYNSRRKDPRNNHIGLIKDSVGNHLVTSDLSESEDGQWHHLKIVVKNNNCSAYVDDLLKFSYEIQQTGFGWIGITSATGGGHNLHAVKNISIAGDSLIDGKYFDVKLAYEKISDNCVEDTINGVYEYEITAEITNLATATARNITAVLDLEEALYISDNIALKISIGDIEPGESRSVSWTVYGNWPEENIAANYGVTININNAVGLRQEDYIYLITRNERDNKYILGVDQWNFSNSYSSFGREGEKIYFIDEDYEALIENLDNIERARMFERLYKKWGGSCYGMAATTILAKMGIIEPSYIQENADSIYAIKKRNNDRTESFINFYHVQQHTHAAQDNMWEFMRLDVNNQLAKIEEMACSISTGGTPFVLCYKSSSNSGHAVVGYGIEYGSYKVGNFSYNSRVLLYNCNAPKKINYLYFNKGTDEWEITGTSEKELWMACNDLSILDYVNHEISTTNRFASLEFEANPAVEWQFYLQTKEFKLLIDQETDWREKSIITYSTINELEDGTTANIDQIVALPSLTEDYSIIPIEKGISSFDLSYENMLLSVDCDTVEQIDFGADGEIVLQNVDGKYSLKMTCNDGAHTTNWYETIVEGTGKNNISLIQSKDGVIVKADNLKDIKIQTITKEHSNNLELWTEATSVLLTSSLDGDKPVVLLDSNDDGEYDAEYMRYAIAFNANGGAGIMNEIRMNEGILSLPTCTFVAPEGKIFKGWSYTMSGETLLNEQIEINGDTVLYAIWSDAPKSGKGWIIFVLIGVVLVGALTVLFFFRKRKLGLKQAEQNEVEQDETT